MNLKKVIIKTFESMIVAWVWLFLVVVHVFLVTQFEPQNIILRIFDKIIMVSCFLVYPFAAAAEKTVWPFAMQFIFWWLLGALMIFLYKKLSK